ncbi:hypothetical protein H0H93_013354, partial [Arthromyces matolae]
MKNVFMPMLRVTSVLLLLSLVVQAIPVSPRDKSTAVPISSLLDPDPPQRADGSSTGGITHHQATTYDHRPPSPLPMSSNPLATNPSIDPNLPIPSPTTHDPAHDEYRKLLLEAIELENEAFQIRSPQQKIKDLMLEGFQRRSDAIIAKARMDKHVTAELVQYHIIKIRNLLKAKLNVARSANSIRNTVGPSAQHIVAGLMTTLTETKDTITYYSNDAPRVDEKVWPLPTDNSSSVTNSETLIQEAIDTKDELTKLPGEVQRQVDARFNYEDLLVLADMRKDSALAESDAQKKEALLLVSFKIRCMAIIKKADVEGELKPDWFNGQVDKIRLT